MKVVIGNYRNFPLRYAGETLFLKLFGISLYDRQNFTKRHKLFSAIINFAIYVFQPVEDWWENLERKRVVKIDRWDTFNADETLAIVIHPVLVAYKKNAQCWFYVDDSDVPEYLRVPELNRDLPQSEFLEQRISNEKIERKRFEWVLDEMIFAFEKIKDGDVGYSKDDERIANGTRLFGRYFKNLWN